MNTATLDAPAAGAYRETREHELRKTRIVMIDGHLVQNVRAVDAGVSARVYHDGYWGFASAPAGSGADVAGQAWRNAQAMARFGTQRSLALPGGGHRGEQRFDASASLGPGECGERLAELNAWCRARYPALRSVKLRLNEERHRKRVSTSAGAEALSGIDRAACYVTMIADDEHGAPVELTEIVSGRGGLADLAWSAPTLAPLLERQHEHLQAKRRAVPARGGQHVVVMGPELTGILAHEAMGHPCEADLVLGGAITRDLVGTRVASELVTMVDFAHSFDGRELMVPVYADDEGTPARDAVLIRDGRLEQFMTSRETAARLGIEATGSARAYGPADEPLVRMRNTAILPGHSSLDTLIAGVEDGYLLLKTSNGQADSTTEFMFGVNLGYEIRGGRIGRAIRDTTVSGSAIKVLQSVDAVSDDMVWTCSGYCGKKQPMIVSTGGPALRARAHLGGE